MRLAVDDEKRVGGLLRLRKAARIHGYEKKRWWEK